MELDDFIEGAPGLAIQSYLLARRAGRLMGFIAVWDQRSVKHTAVLRYTWTGAVLRYAFNTVTWLAGGHRLPPAGAPLHFANVLHLCVHAEEPSVLHTLLLAACEQCRATDQVFVTVGLDMTDPLNAALDDLRARATDIRAYVTTPNGRYRGSRLDDRPHSGAPLGSSP
jgi:hypothetical protein